VAAVEGYSCWQPVVVTRIEREVAGDAHSFEVRLSFLKISEGYRHLAVLAEDMARKWKANS
jgi:hypothetical protein